MNLQNRPFENSAPTLSDEEIEAEVFLKLEAIQVAQRERAQEGVILFQYPDTRTVFQRLRAWFYVRQTRPEPALEKPFVAAEPVWPRHWATMKYL